MEMLSLGVISRARKENEHRVPIHPAHFDQIPANLAARITFERGYGIPFGVSDDEIAQRFGPLASREDLIRESEIVLLPKPLVEDLGEMRRGGMIWGWSHCVQQSDITQMAIDHRLSLLAWEAMYIWKGNSRDVHLFYRNNEMAGYCGVNHALGLCGIDGNYGQAKKAVVLSFGSVSRGAVYALRGHGIEEITIYTQRPAHAVHNQVLGCRYLQMSSEGDHVVVLDEEGKTRPMIEALANADVIVNGILQDTDAPLMFMSPGEDRQLKQGALIVDVSCDFGMGFPFAKPTSFNEPTFEVGHIIYYAVDHTPSYSWRASSWEISRIVVAYLERVMSGPKVWDQDETLRRSLEIREGVIQNPKVLSFQKRSAEYPHQFRQKT
ncbi:MAG: N(5)-(carboxyethyl)ornithine synthase [Deltaproteobacteria bacterium]|nr:N(5)-(carboxyethyl)ornithine synthase [Deltaproteobacteria bacterium]